MQNNVDVGSIIARLSGEFIDDCLDNVGESEAALAIMRNGDDGFAAAFDSLQRHVHSIKGTAATFGFPAIGVIAHRLEDFIEALPDVRGHIDNFQLFLDRIREITDSGANPEGHEYTRMMGSLPRAHVRLNAVRPSREVNVLLVMPRGVQRKIIGQELSACGFGMSFVASGVEAISSALSALPDVVILNNSLDDMTGIDLARTLSSIEATCGINIALVCSDTSQHKNRDGVPEGVAIIKKQVNYTEALSEHLMDWGLFGVPVR